MHVTFQIIYALSSLVDHWALYNSSVPRYTLRDYLNHIFLFCVWLNNSYVNWQISGVPCDDQIGRDNILNITPAVKYIHKYFCCCIYFFVLYMFRYRSWGWWRWHVHVLFYCNLIFYVHGFEFTCTTVKRWQLVGSDWFFDLLPAVVS